MIPRLFGLACAVLAASVIPAAAQQTLNLSVGYSMTRISRAATDILLIEHHDLAFDFGDFNSATYGVEWLVPVGRYLEAGGGASLLRQTVPTVHVGIRDTDGRDIPRNLSLLQAPLALTVRVLPLGQSYRVQPYLGGGVALIRWQFQESGDFAASSRTIFRDEQYSYNGYAVGPVIVTGLRVSGDSLAFGLEGRYQRARGSFGPFFARVVAPDIDLGGWTLAGTAGLRFGR